MRNGFKFLTHLESKTSRFEIVFKSLARLNAQLRVKESFELLLPMKKRIIGDKSQNSYATDPNLNFSGPYWRVRPVKLPNHSVRTKRYNNEQYNGCARAL